MAERLRTFLLVATLMAATAGATLGIVGLTAHNGDRPPAVMVVRPGRAPVQWHGWQLIPPAENSGSSCAHDDYDSCSDGQGDEDQSLDPADDNEPTLI